MVRVLLIDDDPDVRIMMGKLLHKEGYEVETAADRDAAWVQLNKAKPSVILLDVLLSGADGRDLCREIKADNTLNHIPVIMFSGHPGAALRFEAYGADGFIAKPFNTEDLLDKLKQTSIK